MKIVCQFICLVVLLVMLFGSVYLACIDEWPHATWCGIFVLIMARAINEMDQWD
jgi:hypothetical protein